jgi:TolA-binding protein
MKNTLACIGLTAFINTFVFAESTSLESKIKEIDEQIRKEEQQQTHNAKKLQELVTEYNKLVQEHASGEQKSDPHANIEQTHEEALTQRIKEHERRIEELERLVASLGGNKSIPPATGLPSTPVATATTAQPSTVTTATILPTTTTAINSIEKHAADNRATEKAAEEPAPSLDTQSPALAQFNQAMALFNAGIKSGSKEDLKNAAEAFELITTTYPEDTYANKAFVHAGNVHFKLGNIDEAQKFYKIAITKPLDRTNAIRARLGYGETLLAKNNKAEACGQIKALSKELLTDDQKKRFDLLKTAASCDQTHVKAEQKTE